MIIIKYLDFKHYNEIIDYTVNNGISAIYNTKTNRVIAVDERGSEYMDELVCIGYFDADSMLMFYNEYAKCNSYYPIESNIIKEFYDMFIVKGLWSEYKKEIRKHIRKIELDGWIDIRDTYMHLKNKDVISIS